jgi:hypothetical protein
VTSPRLPQLGIRSEVSSSPSLSSGRAFVLMVPQQRYSAKTIRRNSENRKHFGTRQHEGLLLHLEAVAVAEIEPRVCAHRLVALMYPQGSMAIGAAIARASDREEYDIDVIVALMIARDSDPEVVLDALYHAIRGAPGSRYYDKTTRHTRCVCVTYEDGMHIDQGKRDLR